MILVAATVRDADLDEEEREAVPLIESHTSRAHRYAKRFVALYGARARRSRPPAV
ncbi:MAG: hypothetical protein H0U35_10430 [Sporichthyaceae bacterium]|nr:hypothetical protein [Sporichthyaceae bacterium]